MLIGKGEGEGVILLEGRPLERKQSSRTPVRVFAA